MTLDEFEQRYAERSGVTVEWLHAHGRYGTPCDCKEPGCKGWEMKHAEPERRLPELKPDEVNSMSEESALEQCQALHRAFVNLLESMAEALLIPEILDVLTGWLSRLGLAE